MASRNSLSTSRDTCSWGDLSRWKKLQEQKKLSANRKGSPTRDPRMARLANLGESSKLLAEPHSMKTGGFWSGLLPPSQNNKCSPTECCSFHLASAWVPTAGAGSSLSRPCHSGRPRYGGEMMKGRYMLLLTSGPCAGRFGRRTEVPSRDAWPVQCGSLSRPVAHCRSGLLPTSC